MFTDKLLQWYEENQRVLPWRGERNPYKIWVSEIILQQTRVQQGWDYYLRFIDAFPDVKTLAKASEEQVLRIWQGLGYYARARNMHFAAQQVMNDFGGHFPNTYEEIRKLKGIGEYTAAAIGSIAFSLPYPAVDGNVLRIISRIFGVCDDIADTKTKNKITEICQQLIDRQKPGIFNQALMDFGATWCTPQNPQCKECPFQSECYAFRQHMTDTLPIKNNSIKKRERYFHFIVHIYNNCTIIEKRTGKDIWKNLYQFPLIETEKNDVLKEHSLIFETKEVLTHQIIFGKFYLSEGKELDTEGKNQLITDVGKLKEYPMPKIMTTFLKEKDFII